MCFELAPTQLLLVFLIHLYVNFFSFKDPDTNGTCTTNNSNSDHAENNDTSDSNNNALGLLKHGPANISNLQANWIWTNRKFTTGHTYMYLYTYTTTSNILHTTGETSYQLGKFLLHATL